MTISASKREVGADVIAQVDGDTVELQHTDMHICLTAVKAETQSKSEHSMHMLQVYSSTTSWTMTKKLEHTFNTFQRRHLKKILGVHWPKIITNIELYTKTQTEEWSITIQRRYLNWLSHLMILHPETPASFRRTGTRAAVAHCQRSTQCPFQSLEGGTAVSPRCCMIVLDCRTGYVLRFCTQLPPVRQDGSGTSAFCATRATQSARAGKSM